MVSRPPSDPLLAPDPVAAVVDAHAVGTDLLLHTSGTTAPARALVRSTASWWSSFDAYTALSGVERGARVWLPGPMAATMTLFAAVHARAVAATVAERAADATHACLTPAQLARYGDDLGRATRVVVAGDALSPALRDRFSGRLVLSHYYGAAELSFVAAGEHSEDLHAFTGVAVTVVDGEIRVRSPYLARPGSGALRLEDGWATVGDLGRLDGDRLVVLGRPDTVVTAGATVPLAGVEAALRPAASGPFALVGVPHPHLGQVLAAVVTTPSDRATLDAHARSRLAPAERPRLWRVVDDLPLTGAGKVDRSALASLFTAERVR